MIVQENKFHMEQSSKYLCGHHRTDMLEMKPYHGYIYVFGPTASDGPSIPMDVSKQIHVLLNVINYQITPDDCLQTENLKPQWRKEGNSQVLDTLYLSDSKYGPSLVTRVADIVLIPVHVTYSLKAEGEDGPGENKQRVFWIVALKTKKNYNFPSHLMKYANMCKKTSAMQKNMVMFLRFVLPT